MARSLSNNLNFVKNALKTKRIEPENLQAAFRLAFVRWWLPKAIDQSDTLRQFQRFKHEDAIGAIARGRQTIIVGDPKQLPPTNFFGRTEDDEENEDLEDYDRDLESILDEATASGLPLLQLNWHYRSRHESLISFSNWNYYDNKLITFPSARTEDQAVSLKHLPNAVYDRGKTRTNRLEAEAVVADAIKKMKSWINLPEEERLTLGVITFNTQQQSLIQDLFDESLVCQVSLFVLFS